MKTKLDTKLVKVIAPNYIDVDLDKGNSSDSEGDGHGPFVTSIIYWSSPKYNYNVAPHGYMLWNESDISIIFLSSSLFFETIQ